MFWNYKDDRWIEIEFTTENFTSSEKKNMDDMQPWKIRNIYYIVFHLKIFKYNNFVPYYSCCVLTRNNWLLSHRTWNTYKDSESQV